MRTALPTAVAASAVLFAKADGAGSGATLATTGKYGIDLDVPMPEMKVSARGGQSIYPFDDLPAPTTGKDGKPVHASFGLIGKTAKSMASTVSSANKRSLVQALNDDGSPKFNISTVGGAEVRTPAMVPGKKFKAFNVADPAKDKVPGTTVRIYRII